MHDVTCELSAQSGCAETISANVLKFAEVSTTKETAFFGKDDNLSRYSEVFRNFRESLYWLSFRFAFRKFNNFRIFSDIFIPFLLVSKVLEVLGEWKAPLSLPDKSWKVSVVPWVTYITIFTISFSCSNCLKVSFKICATAIKYSFPRPHTTGHGPNRTTWESTKFTYNLQSTYNAKNAIFTLQNHTHSFSNIITG